MKHNINAAMAQYPGQTLYYTNRGLVPNLLPGEKALARLIPEPKEQKTPEVQIGWYRFTDKSYAPRPIEGKTIEGVVAYFEDDVPQSISIEEECLSYSEDYYNTIGAHSKTDGEFNTYLIIKASRQRGVKAPAAEWCVSLGGYLPANEQWLKIIADLKIINASLRRIGAPVIDPYEWYWTSTEYTGSDRTSTKACTLRPRTRLDTTRHLDCDLDKDNALRVRCVLN